MSEEWNAMGADNKKKYADMALEDKARYEKQMAEYNQKKPVAKPDVKPVVAAKRPASKTPDKKKAPPAKKQKVAAAPKPVAKAPAKKSRSTPKKAAAKSSVKKETKATPKKASVPIVVEVPVEEDKEPTKEEVIAKEEPVAELSQHESEKADKPL